MSSVQPKRDLKKQNMGWIPCKMAVNRRGFCQWFWIPLPHCSPNPPPLNSIPDGQGTSSAIAMGGMMWMEPPQITECPPTTGIPYTFLYLGSAQVIVVYRTQIRKGVRGR